LNIPTFKRKTSNRGNEKKKKQPGTDWGAIIVFL